MTFTLITYTALNARQKETFNFQKLSAVLADYGFATMRLSDDWNGADFIAQHVDGETFLRVQLKSRLSFFKKYLGKGLYIAFAEGGAWYLYPHDELLDQSNVITTYPWVDQGGYTFPRMSRKIRALLDPYKIGSAK